MINIHDLTNESAWHKLVKGFKTGDLFTVLEFHPGRNKSFDTYEMIKPVDDEPPYQLIISSPDKDLILLISNLLAVHWQHLNRAPHDPDQDPCITQILANLRRSAGPIKYNPKVTDETFEESEQNIAQEIVKQTDRINQAHKKGS
jgi:hypothetical protein